VAAKLTSLIDKVDGFEIVRDQIAAILAVESAQQQAFAKQADKDPKEWELRVFIERTNAWHFFGDGDTTADDEEGSENRPRPETTPIVNVWWDGSSFDPARGDVVESQIAAGTFNVDVYGYGRSRRTDAGHDSADELAAREVQRAVRLVRNILMAGTYAWLGLVGFVGRRWVTSLKTFQPQSENRQVDNIMAVRLELAVDFPESSPQVEGQELELISLECFRKETGQLLLRTDFPIPTPEE